MTRRYSCVPQCESGGGLKPTIVHSLGKTATGFERRNGIGKVWTFFLRLVNDNGGSGDYQIPSWTFYLQQPLYYSVKHSL